MKKLCILLLLLPALAFSQGKTYFNGYIVTAALPNDTLFGDEIIISNNSFLNVKLKEGKKKTKYDKKDLVDFGYIQKKDKKRISKYAEFSFLESTYKSFYLYGFDQDTMHCYISRADLKPVFNKITSYNRIPQTMNGYKELSLHKVKSFMIIDDYGNEFWYDAIRLELENYEVYGFDETVLVQSYISSYALRLNDGTIKLNETQASIRGNYRNVYVLEKDYKTTVIYMNRGLLNINTKEKLAELMSDVPSLVKKLHDKGYEYEHIPDIIKEYNKEKTSFK